MTEKLITIKDLYKKYESLENKTITLAGWVKTVRDSKTFGFLELNDGSYFKNIQVIFDNKLDNFDTICKLPIISSIQVTGKVVVTPDAKQPFEIKATNIVIENLASLEYPLPIL